MEKKNYSTFLFVMNVQKKKLLNFFVINNISSEKGKKFLIADKEFHKFFKLYLNKKDNLNSLKRIRTGKKENIRLHNLFKEYLFYYYDEYAYEIYSEFIDNYFNKPIKYQFNLTNTMKIKSFLGTSPVLVKKGEEPIIELRTINQRINNLIHFKVKYYMGKVFRFSKKIPRLLYVPKFDMEDVTW